MKLSEFKSKAIKTMANLEYINHLYLEANEIAQVRNNDINLRHTLKRLIPAIALGLQSETEDIDLDDVVKYYGDTWHRPRYWGCILSKTMEAYHMRDIPGMQEGIREMLVMIHQLMVTNRRDDDKIKWEDLI